MCQKSLNFSYAFKCYQQNVSGFTLAGPPCKLRCVHRWAQKPYDLAKVASVSQHHLNIFEMTSLCHNGSWFSVLSRSSSSFLLLGCYFINDLTSLASERSQVIDQLWTSSIVSSMRLFTVTPPRLDCIKLDATSRMVWFWRRCGFICNVSVNTASRSRRWLPIAPAVQSDCRWNIEIQHYLRLRYGHLL